MRLLTLLLAAVLPLAVVPAASAAPRAIAVPGLAGPGEAIARGADGSMWIALPADPGAIARVLPSGEIADYRGGIAPNFTANRLPRGLALTPEGTLSTVWFLMTGGFDELGRLTASGTVGRYDVADGHPTSLANGQDGRLWMTLEGDPGLPDAIVRMDQSVGVMTPFTAGMDADTNPHAITAGPDDALWFVGSRGLGRISLEGDLSWVSIGAVPSTLTTGPLSALWYGVGSAVARLGAPPIATSAAPTALTAGPDGALWTAGPGGANRVEPGGAVTTVSTGEANGVGIAAGADGHMWMTLDRAPYLVRVTVPPRVDAAEATTGAITATVSTFGLDAEARAEVLQPDGSWRAVGKTSLPATLTPLPVSLALSGLTPGATQQVRVTAVSEAGAASTAGVPVTTPASAVAPTADPVPVQGKTVVVKVLSGTVAVKVPGQRAYKKLTGTATLPMKTLLDTSRGRLQLSAKVKGKTQNGRFDSGKFRVTQLRTGTTQLALAGPLACGKRKPAVAAAAAAAAKPKPKKRKLWGSDSGGSFRTRGQNSVATVRGTRWLTEDTCTGTRVRVREGSIRVWPTKGGLSRIVKAGQEIFTPR